MPVVLSSILVARLFVIIFFSKSFYFQLPPQSTKEPPILKKKQMILFFWDVYGLRDVFAMFFIKRNILYQYSRDFSLWKVISCTVIA
jgi:hypothetical protein